MEARIRTVYDEHKGRYGYRRITAALCNSMAEPVNHKCVQRLMQKMGLRALIRAKKRSRHIPGMSDAHVSNVLRRDFRATAPNQKWATDVTEFNVRGQKLYLSACMDLYCGEIVSYRMARRPVFELVSGTLETALSRAKSAADLIVHSDQGWHYKMQPYRAMLASHGVKQSMSRKGNCFDNAAIESFFGTLKAERRNRDRPTSGGQFKPGAIQKWLLIWLHVFAYLIKSLNEFESNNCSRLLRLSQPSARHRHLAIVESRKIAVSVILEYWFFCFRYWRVAADIAEGHT